MAIIRDVISWWITIIKDVNHLVDKYPHIPQKSIISERFCCTNSRKKCISIHSKYFSSYQEPCSLGCVCIMCAWKWVSDWQPLTTVMISPTLKIATSHLHTDMIKCTKVKDSKNFEWALWLFFWLIQQNLSDKIDYTKILMNLIQVCLKIVSYITKTYNPFKNRPGNLQSLSFSCDNLSCKIMFVTLASHQSLISDTYRKIIIISLIISKTFQGKFELRLHQNK